MTIITAIIITLIILTILIACWGVICDEILRPIADWIFWYLPETWPIQAIAMRWRLVKRMFQ